MTWSREAASSSRAALLDFGLDTDSVTLILFVGEGAANGHAFLSNERAYAWLALEQITSPLIAKVFCLHEMLHALQYSPSPTTYFHNVSELCSFSRQLITEGTPTWLTQFIGGFSFEQALWADYLSPNELKTWMSQCDNSGAILRAHARSNFETNECGGIFAASDSNDIFENRSGYYLGSRLIQQLYESDRLSPADLLGMSLSELKQRVWVALSE